MGKKIKFTGKTAKKNIDIQPELSSHKSFQLSKDQPGVAGSLVLLLLALGLCFFLFSYVLNDNKIKKRKQQAQRELREKKAEVRINEKIARQEKLLAEYQQYPTIRDIWIPVKGSDTIFVKLYFHKLPDTLNENLYMLAKRYCNRMNESNCCFHVIDGNKKIARVCYP